MVSIDMADAAQVMALVLAELMALPARPRDRPAPARPARKGPGRALHSTVPG
ncbi:hypothetical protein [Albidovulum sp.]|uniref:hypothetical protein n=1 Tax=Albidovulum sp. TaxID=1872424 RepID=UPI003527A623